MCGWFNGGASSELPAYSLLTGVYYRRNPQYKKHKTWEGDGILSVSENGEAILYDMDGAMCVVRPSVMPTSSLISLLE